jgi:hypothetical protein
MVTVSFREKKLDMIGRAVSRATKREFFLVVVLVDAVLLIDRTMAPNALLGHDLKMGERLVARMQR